MTCPRSHLRLRASERPASLLVVYDLVVGLDHVLRGRPAPAGSAWPRGLGPALSRRPWALWYSEAPAAE